MTERVPVFDAEILKIVANNNAVLALDSNGKLYSWGLTATLTNIPPSATNVISMSIGSTHAIALTADKRIVAWGDPASGRIDVPDMDTNIVDVVAGATFSAGLRSDGTPVFWGGYNSAVTNTPSYATNLVQLSAGVDGAADFILGLRKDGTIVGWGSSNYSSVLNIPPSATNCVSVSAAPTGAVALRADGMSIGWGNVTANQAFSVATNSVASLYANGFGVSLRRDDSVITWPATVPTNPSFPNIALVAVSSRSAYAVTQDGAPRFLKAPHSLEAYIGRKFTLAALTTGQAPISYRWQFNGMDIPGQTQPTLVFQNIDYTNSGTYTVIASNAIGIATGLVANLNIVFKPIPPSIIEPDYLGQPSSKTRFPGQEVSFTVLAAGIPAPTYQWRFSMTNIPNATNMTYDIPSVSILNRGNYQVVVSNMAGSVTSRVAVLSVNIPAPAHVENIAFNQDKTVSLGITGDLGATYILEASSNLVDWLAIQTNMINPSPFQFMDQDAPMTPARFYRLRNGP